MLSSSSSSSSSSRILINRANALITKYLPSSSSARLQRCIRGQRRLTLYGSYRHTLAPFSSSASLLSTPLSQEQIFSSPFNRTAVVVLLGSFLLTITSMTSIIEPTSCEGGRNDDKREGKKHEILPLENVRQMLQSRLQNFRNQRFLRSGGGGAASGSTTGWYPKIALSLDAIDVPLPPNVNEARVLAACLGALQKEGMTCSFHTGLTMPESSTLTFIMSDKSGSVLLNSRQLSITSSLTLFKDKGFTEVDVKAVVDSYIAAWNTSAGVGGLIAFSDMLDAMRGDLGGGGNNILFRGEPYQQQLPSSSSLSRADAASKLRKLGAEVFERSNEPEKLLDWSCLAGYDSIREEVMDVIVTALEHPDKYDEIARRTRERYESNRPRAVLFEGPPGTGKTLTAKIVANLTNVPLVYVPVERIMSKWFGESENKLSKIFETCQEMGGTIIFIDEIDALATSRESGQMHEATRRVLSVILQNIEGFKGNSRNVLIAATNRKGDLDAALLSRFDTTIQFDLPNVTAIKAIYQRYAKHLELQELSTLAEASEGMSCREIKEICENTERKWASKLIREEEKGLTPPLKEYLQAARSRSTPSRHHHTV